MTKTGTEVDGRACGDKAAAAVAYRAPNGADKGNASDTPQDVLGPYSAHGLTLALAVARTAQNHISYGRKLRWVWCLRFRPSFESFSLRDDLQATVGLATKSVKPVYEKTVFDTSIAHTFPP